MVFFNSFNRVHLHEVINKSPSLQDDIQTAKNYMNNIKPSEALQNMREKLAKVEIKNKKILNEDSKVNKQRR